MFQLKVVKEQTVMSEVYKSDGVGLVLKPLDVTMRAEVELATSKYRAQIYDLQYEAESLRSQTDPWITANLKKGETDLSPTLDIPANVLDATRRMLELREQAAILKNGFIYPAWIRMATKKVIGVEIDSATGKRIAFPEELVAMAPIDMIIDLGKQIHDLVYPPAEVQENLELPTTSDGVGGGQDLPIAVPPVELTPKSTQQEIAANTFQTISDSLTIFGSQGSGTHSSTHARQNVIALKQPTRSSL